MKVILTGTYGRCGTAIIDHLHDDPSFDWTYYNRSDRPSEHPYGGYDTIVGNVTDGDALTKATESHEAMVHLAAYPYVDGTWEDVFEPNFLGMYNALEACRIHEVETFVFASTNHVMGYYEREYAPEIYFPGHGIALDSSDPVRPDSYYGASKAFGEDLLRYYIEDYEYPKRGYALRICSVKHAEDDHPYSMAEQAVENGKMDRGSEEYQETVGRLKALWHSRRDFAQLISCCLTDESVEYGIFSGVSDNDRRWFSIEKARAVLDYQPQDNGDDWDGPPA